MVVHRNALGGSGAPKRAHLELLRTRPHEDETCASLALRITGTWLRRRLPDVARISHPHSISHFEQSQAHCGSPGVHGR